MELAHLSVTLDEVTHLSSRDLAAAVASLADGDVIVALAARDPTLGPLGPWLTVGPGYSASMAARDVATLSWLVDFDHVVIAGRDADQHAAVVRAMLSDDEVTLSTAVATVRGAYNRPAPPRPITVWHVDGETLGDGVRSLRASTDGPLTRYRD